MRNRTRPLTVTDRLFGGVLLVLLAGLLVAVFVPAKSGSKPSVGAGEASLMRHCLGYLRARKEDESGWPSSLAEFAYDGVFDFKSWHPPLRIDASSFRLGAYSFDDLLHHRMTREELAAEIRRASPPAWQRLGPITMCLDPRAYGESSPRDGVVVGALKNYPGTKHGEHRIAVAFSDGTVSSPESLHVDEEFEDSLRRSIAYYESIGIPMPQEMVAELRGAIGAR